MKMRHIALLFATISLGSLCLAQTPKPAAKEKERFHIYSTQLKAVEDVLGVPRQGDTVIPFKLISARVSVNDKADAKGFAPTPPKILCYLYDDKKEFVAVTPGIVFDRNKTGKPEGSPPKFRAKVPTEVYFPYDNKTKWKYAIIVIGDDEQVAVASHPTTVKNFDEFAFPEKKLIEKK